MLHPVTVLRTALLLIVVLVAACAAQETAKSPADARTLRDEEALAHLETVEPYTPFLDRLAHHRTRLEFGTWSPPNVPPESAPKGVREEAFGSQVGNLRAWLAVPERAHGPVPVVVALHHDFVLHRDAFESVRAFLEDDVAVFMPTVRGEPGNPGAPQLLLGEVNDAIAAVEYARTLPVIDGRCVYVIGHSIGGGIAAQLALHPEAPVRLTASVGGIYRAHTFRAWANGAAPPGSVRFDVGDKNEITIRLLTPNMRDLAHPHVTYSGRNDPYDLRYAQLAEREAERFKVPFESVVVGGDHMTSIAEAVTDFRKRVARDRSECMKPR